MANGDQFLAQGILQAGQSIGAGLLQRQQNKLLQQQQLQKELQRKFKQLQDQQDVFLKIAGNKSLSDGMRSRATKNLIAINNAINPETPLPAFDKFDEPVKKFTEDLNILRDLRDKDVIDQAGFRRGMQLLQRSVLEQAQASSAEMAERAQSAIQFQQQQEFGTGQFQEFQQDGRTVLGRPTPGGGIAQAQPGSGIQLPPKPLSGEAAGKVSSAQNALETIQEIKQDLFTQTPKGPKVDRLALLTGKLKIPGSKGREIRKKMEFVINNKLRIDSGAAIPPKEMEDFFRIMFPGILESDEFAFNQIQRLEDLARNFLFTQDPQGKLQLIPQDGGDPISLNIQTSTIDKSKSTNTAEQFLKKKGFQRGK